MYICNVYIKGNISTDSGASDGAASRKSHTNANDVQAEKLQ